VASRRRRGGKKCMTAAERKSLKSIKLDPADIKYELYVPLHNLWVDYMNDLINVNKLGSKGSSDEILRRVSKADLHGAMLKVVKCKCPSVVGVTGIVLIETKNTFRIITSCDELKVVPKVNSVFTMQLGEFLVTLYGNNLCYKASERATRSFKMRHTIDL